ncbi:DUF2125 domain-containing protein [Rhodobacterales bacterium]|nr:DUF2125 domain-containing protein [Rhodobacterales bacterium]
MLPAGSHRNKGFTRTVSEEIENRPKPRSRRKYILLLSAVVVVFVAWTAFWFYGRSVLADQLDVQLARLGDNGIDISCSDLSIAGYPFRYEVACRDMISADRTGATGTVGALNAVALIYNPWHVIFEAKSPAAVDLPLNGLAADVNFETARASVKFSQNRLNELDAVIVKPEASFENPFTSALMGAEKTEVHLRSMPDGPETLEGYLAVNALKLRSLPVFDKAVDLTMQLQLPGGADLLRGAPLPALVMAADGALPVRLVLLEALLGHSRVAASGDLIVNGDGTLSGKVDLMLGNAAALLADIKPLLPKRDNTAQLLESIVTSLDANATEVDGRRTITLPMVIERGAARIGFLPLGRLPPLFQTGV